MNSSETDYASMTTEQLQELISQDVEAPEELALPLDTVLQICQILVDRDDRKAERAEAYQRVWKNLTLYMDNMQ